MHSRQQFWNTTFEIIENATALLRSDLYVRVLALANDRGFVVTPAED